MPAFVAGLSIFSVSCASVSVRESARLTEPGPTKLPERIYVRPFTFTPENVRVDRAGADLENFKFDIRERMTRHLVMRLSRDIAPAQAVAATAPLPKGNYWLVTGNFDRVNQGSRLLRAVLGLGLGRTRMDATVKIQDLSRPDQPVFLRISTTGGSNISPGVGGVATFFISGPMALTNLFNVVDGVRSGLSFDAIRTSREVNASVSEFLYQQGVIPYNKAIGPKRLGEFPNRLAPPEPRRKVANPSPQTASDGASQG